MLESPRVWDWQFWRCVMRGPLVMTIRSDTTRRVLWRSLSSHWWVEESPTSCTLLPCLSSHIWARIIASSQQIPTNLCFQTPRECEEHRCRDSRSAKHQTLKHGTKLPNLIGSCTENASQVVMPPPFSIHWYQVDWSTSRWKDTPIDVRPKVLCAMNKTSQSCQLGPPHYLHQNEVRQLGENRRGYFVLHDLSWEEQNTRWKHQLIHKTRAELHISDRVSLRDGTNLQEWQTRV